MSETYIYLRYVDDTFSMFDNINEATFFHQHLNSLHQSLAFTMEVEENHSLLFFNILVEWKDGKFITSVFRKPTFTGLYTSWNSFVQYSKRVNLITTLVDCALMICSTCNPSARVGQDSFLFLLIMVILPTSLNVQWNVRLKTLNHLSLVLVYVWSI